MNKDVLIRKADIGDIEDILRLNFDLFKKENEEYDKSLNLEWTYGEGKKYFRDRIAKKDGFVEVAKVEGRVIGYVVEFLKENFIARKQSMLNWRICWWKKISEVVE